MPATKLSPLCDNNTINRHIATTIDAVGQPGFSATLAILCEVASGYDSTFISAFFKDQAPIGLYDNLGPHLSDTSIAPYLQFAYLLDPFHDLFR